MLSAYRALDLTDDKGFLCGKILGDLGADVIKIEKPGGDPARNIGPFYHDAPDPEKSLFWWAYNTSKRGITLNIETEDGRKIFKKLVETADFVIESFKPGYMDSLRLGYSSLSQINPKLIMVSITPYGQTGPYRDFKGSDLTCMAMSGYLFLQGDPDRPPVRFSFPQAFLHAAAQSAVGALIALYYRETVSGRGQYIDASAQQSLVAATLNAVPFWELNKSLLRRAGNFRVGLSAGIRQRQNWQCKDGYVSFIMIGGRHGAKTNKSLVEWLRQEGIKDPLMDSIDWDNFDMGKTTQEMHDHMEKIVGDFFMRYTKDELHREAVKREMMLYPVNNMKDVAADEQLKTRNFWQEVEHPELGTKIKYPGSYAKGTFSAADIRRRAPLIGEHNLEIYEGELKLSRDEILTLAQAKVI